MCNIYKISNLIPLLFGMLLIIEMKAQNKIINIRNFDRETIHWGYSIGLNIYDFKIIPRENSKGLNSDGEIQVHSIPQPGFSVALITDFRLNNFLNLRFEPFLSYTKRKIVFNYINSKKDKERDITSNYINIPISLKIRANRINNFRLYLSTGIIYSINISSNESKSVDNLNGTFRTTTNNVFYEFGFGVDIYLTYFKLSPVLKMIIGSNNELIPDNKSNSQWTSSMSGIYTRALILSLTFE